MSEIDCIFCKIIAGEVPSEKILENDLVYAFMDINPLSLGHCLFIPKKHATKAHEVDDEALAEILVQIKRVALALGVENYNVLQNNGKIAHQAVMHAHWHLIPKPDSNSGLTIGWEPIKSADQSKMAEKIRQNLE